jgi:hypothetical protein
MKTLAILLLLAAQSTTTPLVDAAKDAKEKRKKSTTKVITNADVKKSKGKLTELTEKDLKPIEPKPASGPTMLEAHDAVRKARLEAAARLTRAQQSVDDLERELLRVEQSYFEENEPNVRDTTIADRFAATKAKLDKAKTELEAARAAVAATASS